MKAALLVAPGKIEFAEIAPPIPAPNEVLIETIRFGICGSDVSLYQGHRQVKLPLTLGHEVVGFIAALGSNVNSLSVGQRVIVEPNYPCGACRFCQTGRGRICPDKISMGVTAPGAAAELFTAPAKYVWRVPDSVSDEDAASIEPLAVAFHAVTSSAAQHGQTIAVVGCGAIGLLIVQVALRQGLRILAHDLSPEKQALASQLGAICPAVQDLAERWNKEEVAVVFECTGAAGAVESCIAAAPRGSDVMLLGLCQKPVEIVPFRLVRESVRIETSLIYDHPDDFGRCIDLVAGGELRPSAVISHTFPIESLSEALELACSGHAGKIHITVKPENAA